jgi:hypothetical protein
MIRFRKSLLLTVALVGIVMLGAPTQAHATFTLRLQSGANDLTVTDNDSNDLSVASGVITFGGSFGSFFVQVTTGSSNSASATEPAQITINNLSITGASSSTLTLTLTDTSFVVPPPGPALMQSQLSTTQIPQGTTVTYQSFVHGSPGTLLSLNSVDGDVVFDLMTVPSTPYTLSSISTFALGAAGTVQTTGITQLSAVPAPAGLVIALTGMPVLGVGTWLRRRKAVVEA